MAAKKKLTKKVYVNRGKMVNALVTKKKLTKKKKKYGKSGQIGSFGGIIFRVSDKKALPMQNVKQELSSRWLQHEVIGSRPKPEFAGAELRTFTLSTIVDVQLGYKPHAMMKKMNQLCEKGKVDILIVGTHKIGLHKWKLEKVSELYDLIYNDGKLVRAKIDMTLSEYL